MIKVHFLVINNYYYYYFGLNMKVWLKYYKLKKEINKIVIFVS